MNNISPCKGCSERHTVCHDHCAKYSEWVTMFRKAQEREKEYKRQSREDFLRSEQCTNSKKKYRVGKVYGNQ